MYSYISKFILLLNIIIFPLCASQDLIEIDYNKTSTSLTKMALPLQQIENKLRSVSHFFPSVFFCYSSDQENPKHYQNVKELVKKFRCAGFKDEKIFLDTLANRPGSGITVEEYIKKILYPTETNRIIVIGSKGLKKKYNCNVVNPKPIVAQEIEILLERMQTYEGRKGVIPIWFEGEYEDCFPDNFPNVPRRFINNDSLNDLIKLFQDVMQDIFELKLAQSVIELIEEKYTQPMKRCKTISFQKTNQKKNITEFKEENHGLSVNQYKMKTVKQEILKKPYERKVRMKDIAKGYAKNLDVNQVSISDLYRRIKKDEVYSKGICFSHSNFKIEEIEKILPSFIINRSITQLKIKDINLEDIHYQYLSSILEVNNFLKELHLENVNWTTNSLNYLRNGLKFNTVLRLLYFRPKNYNFSNEEIENFYAVLKRNISLKYIDWPKNSNLLLILKNLITNGNNRVAALHLAVVNSKISPTTLNSIANTNRYLRIARELEHPIANHKLGKKFQNFHPAQAYSFYKSAAENGGYVRSEYELARYFRGEWGQGQTNSKLAFLYCKNAADKGEADAQYLLAQMYRRGEGVKRNMTIAKEYFKKAALKGHFIALTLFGKYTYEEQKYAFIN